MDPVPWRGSKWCPDWQIGDLMNVLEAMPELEPLKELLGEGHGLSFRDYYYWRQRGNPHIVHRIALVIYRANGNRCRGRGNYLEKRCDPFQKKFTNVETKEA